MVNTAVPDRSSRMNRQVGGGELVEVVARDSVASQGLAQARDLLPVELDTRAHDQLVVLDRGPVVERDRPGLGVDPDCGLADPGHALGHDRRLGPGGRLDRGPAAADQRPQRLVVVRRSGLDHRDVLLTLAAQAGRDGDARAAATHDHDPVPGVDHCVLLASRAAARRATATLCVHILRSQGKRPYIISEARSGADVPASDRSFASRERAARREGSRYPRGYPGCQRRR